MGKCPPHWIQIGESGIPIYDVYCIKIFAFQTHTPHAEDSLLHLFHEILKLETPMKGLRHIHTFFPCNARNHPFPLWNVEKCRFNGNPSNIFRFCRWRWRRCHFCGWCRFCWWRRHWHRYWHRRWHQFRHWRRRCRCKCEALAAPVIGFGQTQ